MKNHLVVLILIAFSLAVHACSTGSTQPSPPDPGGGVPLPPNEDYGVLCFVELEGAIAASAPNFESFLSHDGGLTWLQEDFDAGGLSGSDCTPNKTLAKELWVPPDGQVRYRFNPGESVEISADQGQSWEIAYDLSNISWQPATPTEAEREVVILPGPLDAMIDPRSGNLLLAMGHAGVLVGLSSGDWHWASAGRYTYEAVLPDQIPGTEEGVIDETLLLHTSALVAPDIEINTENNYVNALAFTPDGTVLAVSGFEGGIKLYDFRQSELLHWQQWGQDVQHRKLYGATFSSDGKTLVTCGTNVDQTLNIWDVESWTLIKAYEGYQTSVLESGVYAGKQYFAIEHGQHIEIFKLPDGNQISTDTGNFTAVSSIYFIPKTPYLAMGNASGEVEIWDFPEKERISYFQPTSDPDNQASLSNKVNALGFAPSEDVLMALQGNGHLTAWEVPSGDLARQLALAIPHGWYLNTTVFSEDGMRVAVGMHNGPLLVFDNQTGEILTRQWITDGGTLQQLAFTPDGQWLAAGFADGKVKLWRVEGLLE